MKLEGFTRLEGASEAFMHHMMHQAQAWVNIIETRDGVGKAVADLHTRLSVQT